MKFFLLIIFVIYVSSNLFETLQSNTTCSNIKYVNAGERCDGNNRCKFFLSCVGGFCKKGGIGAECSADT
jgi:hypothetical protein